MARTSTASAKTAKPWLNCAPALASSAPWTSLYPAAATCPMWQASRANTAPACLELFQQPRALKLSTRTGSLCAKPTPKRASSLKALRRGSAAASCAPPTTGCARTGTQEWAAADHRLQSPSPLPSHPALVVPTLSCLPLWTTRPPSTPYLAQILSPCPPPSPPPHPPARALFTTSVTLLRASTSTSRCRRLRCLSRPPSPTRRFL